MINIQSNAMRDSYMKEYVDRTINEIHQDIKTVFGPGATDAYLTKNGQPYYTRDGLEVLESLTFDNELSEYVRKIIFQAAYRQGKKVGDGSTSLIMLYCNMYKRIRDYCKAGKLQYPINVIRNTWNAIMTDMINWLKERSNDVTEDDLLSLMYTCTQDADLSARLFKQLGQEIMNGSYIVVNKSNIETDMEITSYMTPVIKATRLFTVRVLNVTEPNTVIYHCNGTLDIAHAEVLYGLMNAQLPTQDGSPYQPRNIVLLCNGITDVTRKSTKELIKIVRDNNLNPNDYNNVCIYTLDNYRGMTPDEIEDISTMITEEEGIGGLVNDITFEALLYQAFSMDSSEYLKLDVLNTFDCDIRFLDKIRMLFYNPFPVTFNDEEGISLNRGLGPVANARYRKLLQDIENEKSPVNIARLNKRLRNTYGRFIELSVGSKLIKDSQRKFELILDVILSSAEAVRHGVIRSNSILSAFDVTFLLNDDDDPLRTTLRMIIKDSLNDTFIDMCETYYQPMDNSVKEHTFDWDEFFEHSDIRTFDLYRGDTLDDAILTDSAGGELPDNCFRKIDVSVEDGTTVTIETNIVEPLTIMTNILETSTIPLELALAKSFHVSSFMHNYIK